MGCNIVSDANSSMNYTTSESNPSGIAKELSGPIVRS